MRHPSRHVWLPAALSAVALLAVACDTEPGVDEELAEGLEGAEITVGSKEFTEQVILGQMLVIGLEEAGADVDDQTSLAGTAVVRESLETGDIDAYWEYTGTAWADIFGEDEVIGDPDELLETVRERDEQDNDITWGERGDFENTYALAQNQQTHDELGVETLSDLAELSRDNPDEATLCIADEFATRDDGFPGMAAHYDMDVPDANIDTLDEGIIYSETADTDPGSCNFGMVFTTDGRIGALDLHVLEDDEDFFPEYNPALAVRTEVAEEHPQLVDLANEIIGSIDFDTMRDLNLRVDEEGELPDDVARAHLEEAGIIDG